MVQILVPHSEPPPRHELKPLDRERLAFHLKRMNAGPPDGIPKEGWIKLLGAELESIPLDWVRLIEYAYPILSSILNKPRKLWDTGELGAE